MTAPTPPPRMTAEERIYRLFRCEWFPNSSEAKEIKSITTAAQEEAYSAGALEQQQRCARHCQQQREQGYRMGQERMQERILCMVIAGTCDCDECSLTRLEKRIKALPLEEPK